MAPRILRYCWACIRSVPVVFITALIVWSYYAYVFQMCFGAIPLSFETFVYIVIYHPLLVMMMWSYWKSIFTPVAVPPKQFCLSTPDVERLKGELNTSSRREILATIGRTLPIQCRTLSGEMRYCEKCKSIRPDRAHHCSVCGQCILKMDHHCPWVNNCVNFANYKFFCLFLGYALLYSLFVALTALPYFIKFWQVPLVVLVCSVIQQIGKPTNNMADLHIVFLFFAGIMFAISLITLFGYHIYLVSKNRSTLEAFQVPVLAEIGPDKNAFDLGWRKNFIQVFGTRRLYWFLPVFTSVGDGVVYPTRISNEEDVRSSLLGQQQRWAEEGETTDDESRGADSEGQFVNRT